MKTYNLILMALFFWGSQDLFAGNPEIDSEKYVTDEQLRHSALAKDYDDDFLHYMYQYENKKEILKTFKKHILKEINLQQNRAWVVFQGSLAGDKTFHECGSGDAFFGYYMYVFYQDIDRRAEKIHTNSLLGNLYFEESQNNERMEDILKSVDRSRGNALEFLTYLSSQETYVPFCDWSKKYKPELLEESTGFTEEEGSDIVT